MWNNGIVFCISPHGTYTLSVGGPILGGTPSGEIYTSGHVTLPAGLNNMTLATVLGLASASVNGELIFDAVTVRNLDTGFAAIGANDWFPIMFDNVQINAVGPNWTPSTPGCPAAKVGDAIHARDCATNGLTDEDQHFNLLADWGIRHVPSGLCVSASATFLGSHKPLTFANCDPQDPLQQFKNDYTNIRNDMQPLILKAGSGKLRLAGSISGDVFLGEASEGDATAWQTWAYFPNTKQLRNQYVANTQLGYPMCLSTCGKPSHDVPHYLV
jgi:hypothetical protein